MVVNLKEYLKDYIKPVKFHFVLNKRECITAIYHNLKIDSDYSKLEPLVAWKKIARQVKQAKAHELQKLLENKIEFRRAFDSLIKGLPKKPKQNKLFK